MNRDTACRHGQHQWMLLYADKYASGRTQKMCPRCGLRQPFTGTQFRPKEWRPVDWPASWAILTAAMDLGVDQGRTYTCQLRSYRSCRWWQEV